MRKIYNEELIKEEVPVINSDFEFIEMIEFKGKHSKIKIKHKTCGREFETIFNNFSLRKKCIYCEGKKRVDDEKFKEKIKSYRTKDYKEYTFLESYLKSSTPILVEHICGHKYKVRPSDFLYNKTKCPLCYGNGPCKPYSKDVIEQKLQNLNKFNLLKIVNKTKDKIYTTDKLLLECKTCNTIKEVSIHNLFINKQTNCLKCDKRKMFNVSKDSKGVSEIKKILNENNIDYENEKTFNDLKTHDTNRYLRFDFFIEKHNLIIEYDGKFHFEFSESSKIFSKERMLRTQKHDEMKNDYCKKNNINILRISYKDDLRAKLINYLIENKIITK